MKVFKRSKAYASFEYALLIPLVIIIAIFLFVIVKNSAKTLPWLDNALGKTPVSTEEPESYKLNVEFYNLRDIETEGPGQEEGWDGLKKDVRSDISTQDMQYFGRFENVEIDESGESVLIKDSEMEGPPLTNKEIIEFTTNLYMGFLSTVDRSSETLYNKFIIEEVIREFPPGFEDPGDKQYYLEFKPASFIPKKQICTDSEPPGWEVGRFLESIFTVKAYSEVSFSGCYNQFDVNFFVKDLDGNRSKDFSFNINIEDKGEFCVEGSCEKVGIFAIASDGSTNFPSINMEANLTGETLSNEKMDELIEIVNNYIQDNGIKVINKEDMSELSEGEYYIDYVNNTYPEDSIIYVDIYRTSDDAYGSIGIPWNVPIEALCPIAKDSDFSGTTDGDFKYIGSATCVKIPHVIKGVNVTSYSEMFYDTNVKKVISDNSNVTDMSNMFYYSQSTSLTFGPSFDTSKVTNMRSMFTGSQATSLDLSGFDTSNVIDMESMFKNSKATTIDLSSFDTSNVTNMRDMFRDSQVTSLDLSSFNTSKVINMSYMFYGFKATSLDLSSFDTSNVTDMSYMFYNSKATSITFSENFKTSNVTNMSGMFQNSQATSLDLSSFNNSNVTDMSYMFTNSKATTLNLSSFGTSNVTNMRHMFAHSKVTSLDLSSFNTLNVTNMRSMFLSSQVTYINLSNFNTSNVTNMGWMFSGSPATSLNLSSFNTAKVTDMEGMFNDSKATTLDLSNFNTENVTNMRQMFEASNATTLDLSSFNTSKVTNMESMFRDSSATSLNLSSFNTSKVIDMIYMFRESKVMSLDLSSFNFTEADVFSIFIHAQTTEVLVKDAASQTRLNGSSNRPAHTIISIK